MSGKRVIRVMRKGGVLTIPWHMREALKLEIGDVLAIEILDNGSLLLRPTRRKFEDSLELEA